MQNTIEAIVKNGQIVPLEEVELEEGSRALVTILSENDDKEFWLSASESSLNEIWANDEDDIYAELLAK
jgi:predicted DNA-binding antitoxin AbrB/MazE fold protein